MPVAKLRLFKRCAEYLHRDRIKEIPKNTRGVYVLFSENATKEVNKIFYNVVYVGMAGGVKAGVRGRLKKHSTSKRKGAGWKYFSIFEVHDNVSENEVKELEGLIRHIYRKDENANSFNLQRGYKKMSQIRNDELNKW